MLLSVSFNWVKQPTSVITHLDLNTWPSETIPLCGSLLQLHLCSYISYSAITHLSSGLLWMPPAGVGCPGSVRSMGMSNSWIHWPQKPPAFPTTTPCPWLGPSAITEPEPPSGINNLLCPRCYGPNEPDINKVISHVGTGGLRSSLRYLKVTL